jgi:hypothetical protein
VFVTRKAWALGYLGEVSLDGSLKIDDGMEAAAPDALARHGRKERLDWVEPGAQGRREVAGPTRMTRQPFVHPWTPASANRCCQRQTIGRLTPIDVAIRRNRESGPNALASPPSRSARQPQQRMLEIELLAQSRSEKFVRLVSLRSSRAHRKSPENAAAEPHPRQSTMFRSAMAGNAFFRQKVSS